MPNKTISLPDDVLPIIDGLDMPFSRWVTEQLRRHGASAASPFPQQLLADAALSERTVDDTGRRRRRTDAAAVGTRMDRTAPW